ncbi:MAG: signal peptide peptidase SppA [Deltaproteobacteria bacterium]|nr:signal peptide peptidase SppA [Deltaproteobacteria bacterium]
MGEGYLTPPPPRRRPFLRGCLTVALVLLGFFGLLGIISRMDGVPLARGEKVAVVPLSGLISESEPVIDHLKKYGKDDSVKAIVLRIDSPGGGVGPSQEIYEEVRKLRARKPVVTSMGALTASGGYYIACATRTVFANPGTMTGSIGVIMPFMNVKDLVEKIGLKGMAVKSGAYKDMGSPLRDMTPQERELLQAVVDNVHMQFVNAVAEGRNLNREDVMRIADGRIFTGEQAKALGLVDALGNLEDAVAEAGRLGKIAGEPKVVSPPKKKISFIDLLKEETRTLIEEKLSGNSLRLNYLAQ